MNKDSRESVPFTIVQTTETLFSIEYGKNGDFFAVRTTKPRFCIRGKTIEQVCKSAQDAIKSYIEFKESDAA